MVRAINPPLTSADPKHAQLRSRLRWAASWASSGVLWYASFGDESAGCIVMAYIVMADRVMACVVMAYVVVAYVVRAYVVAAYIVMAYTAMAYVVRAHVVWPI